MTDSTVSRRVSSRVEFRLDSPAAIAFQIAVASTAGERSAERFDVTLDGELTPVLTELSTAAGGRVHLVEAESGLLRVDYTATVVTPPVQSPGESGPIPLDDDTITGLRQSRYCPSDALVGFAAREFSASLGSPDLAAKVAAWVFERFLYIPGSSDTFDTAVDTLMKHEGVCRDFAHVTITLCRALGIPARLTSVYAPGITPMDFHAVVEARTGNQWEVLDATRLAPRQALVRIATGRDASDTAFATTLRGAATFTMSEVSAVIEPDFPSDDHAGRVLLR